MTMPPTPLARLRSLARLAPLLLALPCGMAPGPGAAAATVPAADAAPASPTAGAPADPRPDAVVAADGGGDYRTVQDAVDHSPQDSTPERPWVILVRPGTYRELVYIQHEKRYLHLVGTDPASTTITFNLVASMANRDGNIIGTFRTPTVTVDADDFTAEGLTFANTAGPSGSHGQGLAVRLDGDRSVFRNCRFTGWQDTIFDNRGRHLFSRCTVTGAIDFIFGAATSYYRDCTILVAGNGFITAPSTEREDAAGFVFSGCRIARAPGAAPGTATHLGRPWRPFGSSVFLDTTMDDVVRPEGWDFWGDPRRQRTSRFAEWGSKGAGAGAGGARVPWAHRLTAGEAAALTIPAVLSGRDGWAPRP